MRYVVHPIGFQRPVSVSARETVHAVAATLDDAAHLELIDMMLDIWAGGLTDDRLAERYAVTLSQLACAENVALMAVYQTDDDRSGPAELAAGFSLIADPQIRREAVTLAEGLRLIELRERGWPAAAVLDCVLSRLDGGQLAAGAQAALALYARRYCGSPQ